MNEFQQIQHVMGVDFSGASLAGKNAWIAQASVTASGGLELTDVASIGSLAGDDSREVTCSYLVKRILHSSQTLWGCDFPFGLPIELQLGSWKQQLSHTRHFTGNAKQYGLELVERSRSAHDRLHIRRQTDIESRTPFDCYHYRIIYQTFHGMRDVLAPISRDPDTAVLPFQYRRLITATRWIVEACPSSSLKRLGLPHRLYKQAANSNSPRFALDLEKRSTRSEILEGLTFAVIVHPRLKRRILDNPGGDALDAVVAAVGCWHAWRTVQHQQISRHPRFPREGYVYY